MTPALSLNFPKALVAGYPSFMELKVANGTGLPLRNVSITLDCPHLGLRSFVEQIPDLDPEQVATRHVDVHPEHAGSPTVRCEMEVIEGRGAVRFTGICGACIIYEKPENPANLSIVVQDIQSHHSGGDKGEMGSIKGDVSLTFKDLVNVKSVNDLLRAELPPVYHPVSLERKAASASQISYLFVPEPFLAVLEPADVLLLTPESDRLPAVRLCSFNSDVQLGRNGEAADLVTHFLPQSAENDKRTQMLSRAHARLSIAGQPAGLQVTALGAAALVCVGTAAIRPGDTVNLPSHELLTLGAPPADFRLRCALRATNPPRPVRIANLARWIGHRAAGEGEEQDLGRVEIELVNSQPARWLLRWFHRTLSFGRSSAADITLDLPNLDPVHGCFHHRLGTFWIECASAISHSVVVDDHPLADGEIVPLKTGCRLMIGGQPINYQRVR